MNMGRPMEGESDHVHRRQYECALLVGVEAAWELLRTLLAAVVVHVTCY